MNDNTWVWENSVQSQPPQISTLPTKSRSKRSTVYSLSSGDWNSLFSFSALSICSGQILPQMMTNPSVNNKFEKKTNFVLSQGCRRGWIDETTMRQMTKRWVSTFRDGARWYGAVPIVSCSVVLQKKVVAKVKWTETNYAEIVFQLCRKVESEIGEWLLWCNHLVKQSVIKSSHLLVSLILFRQNRSRSGSSSGANNSLYHLYRIVSQYIVQSTENSRAFFCTGTNL